MSAVAAAWAMAARGLEPAEKLTLLVLADLSTADLTCWPSLAMIAGRTDLTAASVAIQLAKLDARGLIARKQRGAPGGATLIRLLVGDGAR